MAVKGFPHKIIVPIPPKEMDRPIPRFSWAVDHFGRDNFMQQNLGSEVVYSFKKEEDAAFFALRWANVYF